MGVHHPDPYTHHLGDPRLAQGAYSSQGNGRNSQAKARQDRRSRFHLACQRSVLFVGGDDAQDERGHRITLERPKGLGLVHAERSVCHHLCLGGEVCRPGTAHADEAGHVCRNICPYHAP